MVKYELIVVDSEGTPINQKPSNDSRSFQFLTLHRGEDSFFIVSVEGFMIEVRVTVTDGKSNINFQPRAIRDISEYDALPPSIITPFRLYDTLTFDRNTDSYTSDEYVCKFLLEGDILTNNFNLTLKITSKGNVPGTREIQERVPYLPTDLDKWVFSNPRYKVLFVGNLLDFSDPLRFYWKRNRVFFNKDTNIKYIHVDPGTIYEVHPMINKIYVPVELYNNVKEYMRSQFFFA